MVPFMGYSSDRFGNYAPVVISVEGLKLAAQQGSLTAKWQTTWVHYWLSSWHFPHHADLTASLSMSSSPGVDPDTCVVAFKGTANVIVSGADDFLNIFNVDSLAVKDVVYQSLKPLESLKLVQVDTFALANLIFPSGHRVRLTSVTLPGDLALQGTMVVPLVVHPDRVNLAPGATQQFSVEAGLR
jgi:hypothetical protein